MFLPVPEPMKGALYEDDLRNPAESGEGGSMQQFKKAHAAIVSTGSVGQAYVFWGGVMTAAFTALVKWLEPFSANGYGWPEAIALGFLATCLTAIGVGLAMMGYRALRPAAKSVEAEPLPPTTADNAIGQIGALRDMLAGMLAENAGTRATANSALETVNGLTEITERGSQKLNSVHQLADLASQKADAAQSTADAAINRSIEHGGTLQTLEGVFNGIAEFTNGLGSKVTEQGSDIAALTKTVDRLLKAQFAMKTRDALDSIEEAIARVDALLYFPEGEGIEAADWEGWKLQEESWRHTISTWVRRAAPYGSGDLSARIKNTPQESFYGTWSFKDSDLPNADTIHRYKAFCIMRRNYFELKDAIDQAVYEAAYG